MDSTTSGNILWQDIAKLINQLPEEERKPYYQGIAEFSHDLNHHLGVIYNAQSLARRALNKQPIKPESVLEWLDMIEKNYKITHKRLEEMAKTLFDGIDVPENGRTNS